MTGWGKGERTPVRVTPAFPPATLGSVLARVAGHGRDEVVALMRYGPAICVGVRWARMFAERLRGLLGTRPGMLGNDVLAFCNCASIHTFGMAYDLDVAFLDAGGVVVESRRAVEPGQIVGCPRGAVALERQASALPWLSVGEVPRFSEVADCRAQEGASRV